MSPPPQRLPDPPRRRRDGAVLPQHGEGGGRRGAAPAAAAAARAAAQRAAGAARACAVMEPAGCRHRRLGLHCATVGTTACSCTAQDGPSAAAKMVHGLLLLFLEASQGLHALWHIRSHDVPTKAVTPCKRRCNSKQHIQWFKWCVCTRLSCGPSSTAAAGLAAAQAALAGRQVHRRRRCSAPLTVLQSLVLARWLAAQPLTVLLTAAPAVALPRQAAGTQGQRRRRRRRPPVAPQ